MAAKENLKTSHGRVGVCTVGLDGLRGGNWTYPKPFKSVLYAEKQQVLAKSFSCPEFFRLLFFSRKRLCWSLTDLLLSAFAQSPHAPYTCARYPLCHTPNWFHFTLARRRRRRRRPSPVLPPSHPQRPRKTRTRLGRSCST